MSSTNKEFEEVFRQVEMIVPHSDALKAAFVEFKIKRGDYTGAKSTLRRISGNRPPQLLSGWILWLGVQMHYFEGDYTSALKLLRCLCGKSPEEVSNSDIKIVEKLVNIPSKEELKMYVERFKLVEDLKAEGNALMKRGCFDQAIATYSKIADQKFISPRMAAIIYSNRAAANQGKKNWALAMADCCRSKSLAPGYAKVGNSIESCCILVKVIPNYYIDAGILKIIRHSERSRIV